MTLKISMIFVFGDEHPYIKRAFTNAYKIIIHTILLNF